MEPYVQSLANALASETGDLGADELLAEFRRRGVNLVFVPSLLNKMRGVEPGEAKRMLFASSAYADLLPALSEFHEDLERDLRRAINDGTLEATLQDEEE